MYNVDEKHLSDSIMDVDTDEGVDESKATLNATLMNNVLIDRITSAKSQYIIDATSFCIMALDDTIASTNVTAIFGGSHGIIYFQNQSTVFKVAVPKNFGNFKHLYNLDHFM